MSVMHVEVYDALRSVPAMDEAKARRAAEAVGAAALHSDIATQRSDRIEKTLDRLEGDVQSLKTDVHVQKWMVGVVIALSLGILGKLLFV